MKQSLAPLLLALPLAACGTGDQGETPDSYGFQSRFLEGESSVAYSGQVGRWALIESMTSYMGAMNDQTFTAPETGDVFEALDFYYDFKNKGGSPDDEIALSGHSALKQTRFGQIGSIASLLEKMPEQDADFVGGVIGYGDGNMPPGVVVEELFANIEALVLARSHGEIPQSPDGASIALPYVDERGIDHRQLLQKFLAGAVPYSQAADDYLDDDKAGKGLLSGNADPVMKDDGPKPYTDLEHAWDEGFGYFGAARNYGDFTDEEIAGSGGRSEWNGAYDSDADGTLDLKAEWNWRHAVTAGKRDLGSSDAAKTDFTTKIFQAFLEGRTLISNAEGDLTDAELAELKGHRDTIVHNWEKALAATVVHYANDTLKDSLSIGTEDYEFLNHAKHWAEMKGYAMMLQFNVRHSQLDQNQLTAIHQLIGQAPLLESASAVDRDARRADLNQVKAMLGDALGFANENLGDDSGNNGW